MLMIKMYIVIYNNNTYKSIIKSLSHKFIFIKKNNKYLNGIYIYII